MEAGILSRSDRQVRKKRQQGRSFFLELGEGGDRQRRHSHTTAQSRHWPGERSQESVVVARGEGQVRGGKVLSNVRNLIMFLAGEIEADGEGEIKCLSEWMINGPTLE